MSSFTGMSEVPEYRVWGTEIVQPNNYDNNVVFATSNNNVIAMVTIIKSKYYRISLHHSNLILTIIVANDDGS